MFSDNGGPPYEPYKMYFQLYEELRVIIDGSSESMTHRDAVELLKEWKEKAWMYDGVSR